MLTEGAAAELAAPSHGGSRFDNGTNANGKYRIDRHSLFGEEMPAFL